MQDGSVLPPDSETKAADTEVKKTTPPKEIPQQSHPAIDRASQLAEEDRPRDAIKSLAEDTHPESPEEDSSTKLGLAPFKVRRRFRDGTLDISGSEKATQDAQKPIGRMAEGTLSRLTPYDWSEDPQLHEFTSVAEQIIRATLRRKLENLGLFDEASHADNLIPHYVQKINDDPYLTGIVTSDTGLILVKPYLSGYPLMTISFVAHEMSHGTAGITVDFVNGDQIFITGLDRIDSKGRREGALLENALAELDYADAYTDLQSQPILYREVQRRRKQVSENSAEHVREAQAKGEKYEAELRSKLLAARKLGIPTNILEAHAEMVGGLDQVVIMWKLCRIVGSKLPNLDPQQRQNSAYLFQQGRNFFERSRYAASTDALVMLRTIFGDDAEAIISSSDHPDSLDAILKLIQHKEQDLNLPGIQNREAEDFSLY